MSLGGLLLLLGVLTPWAELTPAPSHKGISICDLPLQIGTCNDRVRRFYYNMPSNECREFVYSGCQGNANNFKTREECRNACVEKPGVCPGGPHTLPCIEQCENDWKCPGEEKCCHYGCQSVCKVPIYWAHGSPTKRPSRIGSTVRP